MNATLKTITLATIVAGAIVLAGCTPASTETTPTTAPTSSTAQTPAPVESSTAPKPTETTPAKPAEVKTGDVIDAATAKAIKDAFRTPADDAAYETTDGSFIVVNAGDPVPEKVAKDTAVATEAVGKGSVSELTKTNKILDAFSAAEAKASTIGRSVAVICRVPSWSESAGAYVPMWGNSLPGAVATTDIDTQRAFVNEWVAKSPATRYVAVVDLYN